ncbi:MAG: Calx-beta domain-containing protein [Thermoleophilaceae bacterium]
MRTELAYMRVRALTLIATVFALALVPSTALAAPKKVFLKFSATSYSVAENAGGFDVKVQRTGNTSAAASVDYSDNNTGTATGGGVNYSFAPGTLNFAAGETSKTFHVTIVDNGTANAPNKTIVFKLSNATSSAQTQIKTPTSTLTIIDNEGPGTIDFNSTAYTVVESAGLATITVTRTGASNLSVSVDYSTSGGTASGSDYTAIPTLPRHTLTFAPGETSKVFQVAITDDSDAESPETVNLVLSNPQNLTGGSAPQIGPNGPAVLTINDDDVSTFDFQSSLFSVGEGAGQATITVVRSGATNIPASVDYSTSDNTATAGSDYTATNGTVNFAAGETQKTFNVAISDDASDEPNETVNLTLTSGATTLATSQLSIVDNDAPTESVQFSNTNYSVNEADGNATITVTLSHALGVQTTVDFASSAGSAIDGSDYTGQTGTLIFAPGETEKTIQIAILNPSTPDPEDDETLTITLSNALPGANLVMGSPSTATLTILDDDPPGSIEFTALGYDVAETGGQATVTVHRVGGVGGPVSVDYATTDGTAGGSDYTTTTGTLDWAAGDSADKTFTVPVTWDGRGEGPETINLTLSNPGGGADLGTNNAAVIRIADDGASGPLQLTSNAYNAGEADGTVTITVTRSGGSLGGPVTVDYATSDGSATGGSDYTATSGTLTFGPGEATKSFTVPVGSDSAHEDAETFQVTLSNPGGGASLGSPAGATVTIADDDPAPAAPATGGEQSTPANPNPAGSQTAAADKTAPKLKLSAKAIQRALKLKLVALSARCNEACTLKVTAKIGAGKKAIVLGRATARAASGKTSAMKVKLSKRALAKLRRALKGGKAKIVLTVTATDAAGNKAAGSRKVTVKA